MPQVLRTRPHLTLNTDGKSHPVENTLAVITLLLGLVAIVTGTIPSAHLIAVIVGLGGALLGLFSQLISATTAERWLNVIGIGAAAVGMGLGLAHGGFAM